MVDECVQLRSLYLITMQLTKPSLDLIAQLVEDSDNLEDLDVSWNNFLPGDFTNLFNALSKDKEIRTLNLSCNMIIQKAAQNNLIDFRFDTALEEYE